MHENATVQHTRSKWIGKVGRAPDGDRAGAFYCNDTTSFYVTWQAPAEATGQAGWIPAADLVRVV